MHYGWAKIGSFQNLSEKLENVTKIAVWVKCSEVNMEGEDNEVFCAFRVQEAYMVHFNYLGHGLVTNNDPLLAGNMTGDMGTLEIVEQKITNPKPFYKTNVIEHFDIMMALQIIAN